MVSGPAIALESLEDVLRGQAAVGGWVVGDRIPLLEPGQVVDPLLVVTATTGGRLRAEQGRQVGDHLTAVADDRHVDLAVLADLGRVDVGVDHQGARRERVEVAGHPVVEPSAQRHDQVAALEPGHRGHGAVHPRHAEVLRVAVGEGATRHQGGDHRDAGQGGQLEQLAGGARTDGAATDVEDGPLGVEDQPDGLLDLLGVGAGHRSVAGEVDLGRPDEASWSPAAPTWRRRRAPDPAGRSRRCGRPPRSCAGSPPGR